MAGFISIDPPEIDSQQRAIERILLQFRKSPVLLQVLYALTTEIQVLQDVIRDVLVLRAPADARDEQLNAIGRIVGQERELVDYSEIGWFAPDTDLQSCDQAPSWVETAPLADPYVADDVLYKELIAAKIFRNFCKFGSVPEVVQMAQSVFGIDIGFIRTGLMQTAVVVPNTISLWGLNSIFRFEDTQQIDGRPFLPYPATLEVTDAIYYIPDQEAFIADIGDGHQVDIGKASVYQAL